MSSYVRRDYYRIVLVIGSGVFKYGDKVVEIDKPALFVGNKTIPYSWIPISTEQKGWACVFSEHLLRFGNQDFQVHNYSIFNSTEPPVFFLNENELSEFSNILENMQREMSFDYMYKYSLLQSYLLTLIHKIQKIENSIISGQQSMDAAHRTTYRFLELIEQQFPIESPHMPLVLKKPNDYAQELSMHVNSLNHSVKQVTGKTSTILIANRVIQEAKALLLNSDWTITEISDALGFEQNSHFTNYFRKYSNQTPTEFRQSRTII